MIKEPIYKGILQSDLDCAGFDLLNFDGGGGGAANGIPAGGTTGQLLQKQSGTDFDADWATVATGGGGGGTGADVNTVTAADIGLVGDGVTDNTTALQTWLNAVGVAKVSSTLLVPDGVYIFSGALQDGSRRNAQILLPAVAQSDPSYSLTIKGYHPISTIAWPGASVPVPKGPIFKSTLSSGSGTQPAFIGGKGPVGGVMGEMCFLRVCFENMIFQTVQNPQISCLNLSAFSQINLAGDVAIIAGTGIGSLDMSTQPTTATSYGLLLPPNNQSVLQQIENANIFNFYTGAFVGELSHITNIACYMCVYSLEFNFAYHVSVVERLLDWWCPGGIVVRNSHTFQIEQFDIEQGEDGHWWSRVTDVYDPLNAATAEIAWWAVKTVVGALDSFVISGGAGVKARRVGTFAASPLYIGTDMRLVAITGGGKLQARNTSTNTWADVDQWTNP